MEQPGCDGLASGITVDGAAAKIERNKIDGAGGSGQGLANETVGVTVKNGTATIQSNTISNFHVGVDLYPKTSVTIRQNNFENNSQNVILEAGATSGVNAAGNWWGTADIQAVAAKIHDYRSDFNLGKVNTQPILNSPNTQATPNPDTPIPTVAPPNAPAPRTPIQNLLQTVFYIFVLAIMAAVLSVGIVLVLVIRGERKRQLRVW
jgi:hypothetical protein